MKDFKTHAEALHFATGIASLTGLHVSDLSPGHVSENFDKSFAARITRQSLRPYLHIHFLDGQKEELQIRLKWVKDGWWRGSVPQPGLSPRPTKTELLQFNVFPGQTTEPGEWAMEEIYSDRYEGDLTSGRIKPDHTDARECPTMFHRPFEWAYVNAGEPPDHIWK